MERRWSGLRLFQTEKGDGYELIHPTGKGDGRGEPRPGLSVMTTWLISEIRNQRSVPVLWKRQGPDLTQCIVN